MAGVDPGAALHDAAHPPERQSAEGVLAGEHHVDEHAQRIDVRPGIGLGDAVLLRRGKAHRVQDLGVIFQRRLVEPGGVKVDENGVPAPQNDVLRLDVPMDGAYGVQDPQCLTDLCDDVLRLPDRKKTP